MSDIEHRRLRSALEFAVLLAAEGQKRRPPLAFPKELKPFLTKPRLATASLGRVRRIIESDDAFRAAVAAVVLPELVDEVGRLWLSDTTDWEQQAAEIIAAEIDEAESKDVRRELKRAEKRRVAAEHAAARIQAEVLARDQTIATQVEELDVLRADIVKAADELDEVRSELIDTRNELRHARDREAAAVRRAEAAATRSAPESSDGSMPAVSESREAKDLFAGLADHQLADERARADDSERRLAAALESSRAFADELERLLAADEPANAPRGSSKSVGPGRTPIKLPGGVISTSAHAAEHLVRADAAILVDGYNVAKLGWPGRSLEQQRDALINRTENLARRHGADVTIVFDGDSVVGAHAGRHRTVRVVFSPSGVTADDVIRSEVARLPVERAVIVVTNDREIIDDVRSVGSNVVPSNAFIAIL